MTDTVWELSCNLDDMTPEDIAFAMERLLDAGALDVWTTPIGMKKNRPGIQLSVLSREDRKEELAKCLFRHTTTLGIRQTEHRRYLLRREFAQAETLGACPGQDRRGPVQAGVRRPAPDRPGAEYPDCPGPPGGGGGL